MLYTFTVVLAGLDELTPEVSDTLYEAGIDGSENAIVGSSEGRVTVDYEDEYPSLAVAIGSAVAKIEKAGYKVARIEVHVDTPQVPTPALSEMA
jgi:hypothetical protein